jgi:CRP/FNR family transcriptional regulator
MSDRNKLSSRLESIWKVPEFSYLLKASKRIPLRIPAGKTIFFEGDEPHKIYFIKRGFVKLYRMSPEGRDTIIYLYGPGSILGLRALTTGDKSFKHNAEAMTDVEVITFPEKDYFEILEQHPEYLVDLMHAFIERLNYTERKLEGFILTDTTARVASFLYSLVERFVKVNNNKCELPLTLTHQTISEFVGAFRETVTVAMNRLKKDGVLEDKRGKITIINVNKLKKHALI